MHHVVNPLIPFGLISITGLKDECLEEGTNLSRQSIESNHAWGVEPSQS